MLPLLPGVKIGCHVEVFQRNASTGEQELVHTSRPGEVCGKCGDELGPLAVAPAKGTPICPRCRRGD